jgi:aryl-alcohol dehydrogenase-like predicted oxidoreductase
MLRGMSELGHTALGSWSGGRHMHFGIPLEEDRLRALLRPGDGIHTVVTADVYGRGAADTLVGEAVAGLPREDYALVGAVGHDFYEGEREGAKGFPRFTDPRLRGPGDYAGYLRMATERSLERCGVDHFDLLMLHNPDRIGYSSEVVWSAMEGLRAAGLTRALGLAPGPANGFTLDVIGCLERFGPLIDWAMIILNPFEPWPGRLVLPVCREQDVRVLARVVDYGGVFHDDVPDEPDLPGQDHRAFRPAGWVDAARARLDRVRPIAERHGLTPLQLSCQWTLAQAPVASVAPTLIQEPGPHAKPVEQKRAELAAVPREVVLSAEEVAEIAGVGENAGCMALKGGTPGHDGDERADSWPVTDDLRAVARLWGIEPERDLVMRA